MNSTRWTSSSDANAHRSIRRRAGVLALLGGLVVFSDRASALVYVVDNNTTGAVNFSAAAATTAGCATPLARTFTVAASGTVQNVGVGFNITHTNRGDIRVTLVAPDGTTNVQVMPDGRCAWVHHPLA